MLYIDDKKLTISEIRDYQGRDKFYLALQQTLLDIYDNPPPGGKLRFSYGARYITQTNGQRGRQKTTIREKKRGIRLPLTYTVSTSEGSQAFTYCKTAIKKSDGTLTFSPRKMEFNGSMSLDYNSDADLILFMIHAVPDFKSGGIIMENPAKKAKEFTAEQKAAGALAFYLYNDDSLLADDEKRITDIARAWGITVDNDTPLDIVKKSLYEAVQLAEKQKNKARDIKAFVSAVKEELPHMEQLVTIQKAIDAKYLMYNIENSQYVLKVNDRERKLVVIPPGKKTEKETILAEWLLQHPDVLDVIESLIAGQKVDGIDKGSETDEVDYSPLESKTYDEIEGMKWQELKMLARQMRLPHTLKKDEILDVVKKFYDNQ